jgi:hypothetical protein
VLILLSLVPRTISVWYNVLLSLCRLPFDITNRKPNAVAMYRIVE